MKVLAVPIHIATQASLARAEHTNEWTASKCSLGFNWVSFHLHKPCYPACLPLDLEFPQTGVLFLLSQSELPEGGICVYTIQLDVP